jgi:hypothetical protein
VGLTLEVAGSALSSYGYFNGFSFRDNGGKVSATNVFGTPDNSHEVFGDPSGQAPANVGVTTPGVATGVGGLVNPFASSGAMFVITDFNSFEANFRSPHGDLLSAGSITPVFGFTSDLPPTFDTGSIQDGASANGTVPTPEVPTNVNTMSSPEPSGLTLFALGGALTFLGLARRRLGLSFHRKEGLPH